MIVISIIITAISISSSDGSNSTIVVLIKVMR